MPRAGSIALTSMTALAAPLATSAGKLPDLKKFSRVGYSWVHFTRVRSSGGFYSQPGGSYAYSVHLDGRANVELSLSKGAKRPDFKADGLPVNVQIRMPVMHAYAATSWLRSYLAECSQAALAALQGRLELLVRLWGAATLGTIEGAARKLLISVDADPAHLERMFCTVFEPVKEEEEEESGQAPGPASTQIA